MERRDLDSPTRRAQIHRAPYSAEGSIVLESNQPPTGDPSRQLNQLTQFGGMNNLHMSQATHKNYISAICEFRHELQQEYDKAARLGDYGNVGGLSSAQQTKTNLANDIHGKDGLLATLKNYIEYLESFEQTVNHAYGQISALDQCS